MSINGKVGTQDILIAIERMDMCQLHSVALYARFEMLFGFNKLCVHMV
jgi:hypothetical protein